MATVVFDANGTLFDLAPVAEAIGGKDIQEAFFERLLHSAATATSARIWIPLDDLAASVLATTCAILGLAEVDQSRVLEALKQLPPYPDAREAWSWQDMRPS